MFPFYLKINFTYDDTRSEQVSENITERLVIAGYGWDRVLQYHSKVRTS
jgi:hypothetical protein